MSDAEYAIENGWLVEVVNEHTCGTGRDGHYGAHEPGCGRVPIERIDDLLRKSSERCSLDMLFSGAPDTPCRTVWRDGVECVEVPMEDLRAAFDGSYRSEMPVEF